MNEQAKNKRWQDILEANGAYAIKTIVTNEAGTHDIICCIPNSIGIGRFCSLEGKLKDNKMSILQVAKRNEVIRAGGIAIECKEDADVYKVIKWAKEDHIQVVETEERQLKTFKL